MPGNKSLEQAFIDVVEGDPEHACICFGCEKASLMAGLNSVKGRDPHDWFEELTKFLGVTYEQAIFACVEAWLLHSAHHEAAAELVGSLASMSE